MKPFTPPQSPDGFVTRLILAIEKTFASLARAVTNDRVLVVDLTTADTRVFHGLGAEVQTWEVVDKEADVNVWRSPTENPSQTTYIILQASAPTRVKVRFT